MQNTGRVKVQRNKGNNNISFGFTLLVKVWTGLGVNPNSTHINLPYQVSQVVGTSLNQAASLHDKTNNVGGGKEIPLIETFGPKPTPAPANL